MTSTFTTKKTSTTTAAARQMHVLLAACLLSLILHQSIAFTTTLSTIRPSPTSKSSSSALNVWWFGGTEQPGDDRDECELVAVRIERTSANSRRIWGEIDVPGVEMDDVWSILTDYDRLSTHVPNLVQSKRVDARSRPGQPGDGSYQCRLYQQGAQKIIGFEFGASVTMDMTERVMNAAAAGSNDNQLGEKRGIGFKCVESQFFSEFDGEWMVSEGVSEDGVTPMVSLRYQVDVRPKGPVPVAALEWRIREDVPTNLRAVKKASVETGKRGVMEYRARNNITPARNLSRQSSTLTARVRQNAGEQITRVKDRIGQTINNARAPAAQLAPLRVKVNWADDETMARYLRDDQ
mmetsp:Transcript_15663/g.24372  ORF Transcript_15663/g.24372 Transcript_15663/m.24372 type:complete len:350 (+) Transcript_15663:201-1250(+)|eukprot:CAMPEP_0196802856 /NCGR_PEP_ID=MMETSP1362-20130617/2385_1 /TAXON_ID=163516 /ORGANISM="Leptocylindrus danicus, Strain CCMP1856" /LENGTH=349 /DNA_ID=CAMNT_0042174259 /DNA_START=168 /DNA_END=1217 /DNA_ORIENTATION=+